MSTHRKTIARDLAARVGCSYQTALEVVRAAAADGALPSPLDAAGRARAVEVCAARYSLRNPAAGGVGSTPARFPVDLDDVAGAVMVVGGLDDGRAAALQVAADLISRGYHGTVVDLHYADVAADVAALGPAARFAVGSDRRSGFDLFSRLDQFSISELLCDAVDVADSYWRALQRQVLLDAAALVVAEHAEGGPEVSVESVAEVLEALGSSSCVGRVGAVSLFPEHARVLVEPSADEAAIARRVAPRVAALWPAPAAGAVSATGAALAVVAAGDPSWSAAASLVASAALAQVAHDRFDSLRTLNTAQRRFSLVLDAHAAPAWVIGASRYGPKWSVSVCQSPSPSAWDRVVWSDVANLSNVAVVLRQYTFSDATLCSSSLKVQVPVEELCGLGRGEAVVSVRSEQSARRVSLG